MWDAAVFIDVTEPTTPFHLATMCVNPPPARVTIACCKAYLVVGCILYALATSTARAACHTAYGSKCSVTQQTDSVRPTHGVAALRCRKAVGKGSSWCDIKVFKDHAYARTA